MVGLKGTMNYSTGVNRFRGLRIHSRLHLISFVFFSAILTLGATYYYGHQIIQYSLTRQTQLTEMSHLASQAKFSYLQMQTAEKNFRLFQEDVYIKNYNAAILEIENTLTQSMALTDDDSLKTYIRNFKGEIELQKKNFGELIQLLKRRGLNEDLGLHGELRTAIHKIEKKLVSKNLQALSIKMLMMRRHEKDFILRGRTNYIDLFNQHITEFKTLLMSAQISPGERTELGDLVKTYQDKFEAFTNIIGAIDANTASSTRIYETMTPGFQVILDTAARSREQAEAAVVTTRNNIARALLVSLVFILLISTGLIHFVGRSIAAPILKQTDTVKRLARGDASIEISDTELNNEIGAMARAMQVFKNNSNEHLWAMDSQKQLEKIAYFDELTGLANRAHCQKDLAETFAFAAPGERFAIIQIDLDNFKRVNDSLGHAAGDHLLQILGARLNFLTKELTNLKPYRWGGDEFIVLVQRVIGTDMEKICQELTDLISVPIPMKNTTLRPTVSLGVARFPEDGQDISALMVFADLALYKTKELGRDGYQFFTTEMKQKIDIETRIEQELRVAIDEDQLELYFQPQVDTHNEVISGIEALLRWNHPERGLLPPAEFLPVAEATGLASAIGRAVFEEAMKAVRHWSDAGLEFGRLSVNLSPQHLKKKTVVDDLFSAMEKYGVGPESLVVEILESFLFDDPNADIEGTLNQLKTRGINVELDDFGTGYASLSHLSKMPINGLKIDRSFVNHMVEDKRQQGIVNALISISKLLDLRVVCEGVENQHQLQAISQIGNCAIQGYFIARPMNLAQTTDWIKDRRNVGLLSIFPKIKGTTAHFAKNQ